MYYLEVIVDDITLIFNLVLLHQPFQPSYIWLSLNHLLDQNKVAKNSLQ